MLASPPPPHPPMPGMCANVDTDFTECQGSPAFIATGSTGCCPQMETWVPGICNLCTHEFSCPIPLDASGFKWGACVAVVVNIAISIGMALQKQAHTAVEERVTASAKISDEAADAARKKSFVSEKRWWVGFVMQVGGEIGNLVAYGDPNTPASVVASLGCSAVVANSALSFFALGEECQRKDVVGIMMIIIGVVLIIEFVPRNPKGGTVNLLPCPIAFRGNYSAAACELPHMWPIGDSFLSRQVSGVTACEHNGLLAVGSDYWYFVQPEWLCYLMVMILAFIGFLVLLRQNGPKHCASYLILADIAGGFTVCASVTISTFLFTRLIGEGHWYVLAEPIFWLCVLVLAATLPVQVNYLNKALAEYDASIVVPTHYVLFTLASIGAPSVLYQELTLNSSLLKYKNAPLMVFAFGLGVLCTCWGVIIVSKGKVKRESLAEIGRNSERTNMDDRQSGVSLEAHDLSFGSGRAHGECAGAASGRTAGGSVGGGANGTASGRSAGGGRDSLSSPKVTTYQCDGGSGSLTRPKSGSLAKLYGSSPGSPRASSSGGVATGLAAADGSGGAEEEVEARAIAGAI